MSVKTEVISARIPVDTAKIIREAVAKSGLTMSRYLTEVVTQPQSLEKTPNLTSKDLPKEVNSMLSAVGGAGLGLLVYKVLKTYMPKDRFSEEQIDNIAIISALASGLGSYIALNKMINKK
jgi:hypothetical protein